MYLITIEIKGCEIVNQRFSQLEAARDYRDRLRRNLESCEEDLKIHLYENVETVIQISKTLSK